MARHKSMRALGAGGAGFDLFEALAGAVHLLEDALDAGGPDKRCGLGVPGIEEGGDGVLRLGHAAKGAAPHGLLFEFAKPAFDQV